MWILDGLLPLHVRVYYCRNSAPEKFNEANQYVHTQAKSHGDQSEWGIYLARLLCNKGPIWPKSIQGLRVATVRTEEGGVITHRWLTYRSAAGRRDRLLGAACFSEHVYLNSILHKQTELFHKR